MLTKEANSDKIFMNFFIKVIFYVRTLKMEYD